MLKTGLLLVIFIILLMIVCKVVVRLADERNYSLIAGFYEERKNSLDAIYLGSSSAYAFWVAPVAWKEYGISVFPFASSGQPLEAAQSLVKEARKTQPDALYIVSVTGPVNITPQIIHCLVDYFPFSLNKLQMIHTLCGYGNILGMEQLEFYFPLFRYHSRWNELTEDDFHYAINGLKGGSEYDAFLKSVNDISNYLRNTEHIGSLSKQYTASIEDFLDYCDEEQVNVLFVSTPRGIDNESQLARINAIGDLVESRGYPFLDMLKHMDEIGLDATRDYYNENHTNIHGALKTTRFLAEYLLEHYDFSNTTIKHDNASWDLAYEKYMKLIGPYTLDIERNAEPRDNLLLAPKLSKVSVNGTSLTVSWEKSDGADGYRIYRKDSESAWSELGGEFLRVHIL